MLIYNLDTIISVGYRVNSKRGTQFRIWATNVLKEHLIKGYTILLFLWFLNENGILYNGPAKGHIPFSSECDRG